MTPFISLIILSAAAIVPDIAEESVLKARRGISKGEVRLQTREFRRNQIGDWVNGRVIMSNVYFRGDDIRTVKMYGTAGKVGDAESFSCFAKEDSLRLSGKTYVYVPNLTNPETPTTIQVAKPEYASSWKAMQKYLTDPRLLGLQPVPYSILHSCNLQEFVGNTRRTESKSFETVFEGTRVRVVELKNGRNSNKMWISSDHDWNLLQAEIMSPESGRYVIKCELSKFGTVWYPKTVTYESYDLKGELIEREVTTTQFADFATNPGKHLSIAAMMPVKETMLMDAQEIGKCLGKWDGKKIGPCIDSDENIKSNRWLILIVANIIAFVALAVWYKSRTR